MEEKIAPNKENAPMGYTIMITIIIIIIMMIIIIIIDIILITKRVTII